MSEHSERRAQILAEWKKNSAELVERFDEDGDGCVDMDEWERAREAAETPIDEHTAKAAMKPDVDVLMKPETAHPFTLSNESRGESTRVYHWKALGGLFLFIGGVVALGVTLTARFAS